MFQRRNFCRRAIVSAVALAVCSIIFITSATAQEAPRESGSLIKPPTIKPPTARSQTTSARASASSRRRKRRARRGRARIAARRAVGTRASATPRAVQGAIVDSPDSMPHAAPPVSVSSSRSRAPISGGVLNGRALTLPPPVYPPLAKAANAAGTVAVRVLIDENGKIVEAEAISGPNLLRRAAEEAARNARFLPTQLSGQPVQVTGVITYTFVVPQ